MGLAFNMKYIEKVYNRYFMASKASRGKILDELCDVCRYNRKYAIWKLHHFSLQKQHSYHRKKNKKVYDDKVLSIIKAVWESANYPWSVRLKEILRLWLPWIRQRFAIATEIEQKLIEISPSTIDRYLKIDKMVMRRRIYGRTKPGTLLRHHIPIKCDHWDVNSPGFVEIDLVSHSGECATGEFIYSLNLTDIYSGWVESRAVMGRGEAGVLNALQDITKVLPFHLVGIDSDNGSEFINYHLLRYCKRLGIQFTRSRPYKKDDNAHIEQKNWTHIRKLIGWDRYDSSAALQAMNELYRGELRLFMNLYQPSVKLIKTIRIGSRMKRMYDKPSTPFDRLLKWKQADRIKLDALQVLRHQINPFELSERVNNKLERIFRFAHHRFQSAQVPKNSEHTTEKLSEIEQQTVDAITEIFGIKVSIRNRKEELITPGHG